MKWVRRLWFWNLDWWRGATWALQYTVRPGIMRGMTAGHLAPVLLLPGVYETWRFMKPVAAMLNRAGHPVYVVQGLGNNQMPIQDAAALAQRHLEHLDLTGVVVVGHSKGGLIGKHMMAVDDTSHRITSMVAIATPFSGSSLARYAPVRTLRAFSPNDGTLSRLTLNRELNSRITSIYSEFDPIIPGRSSLDGATNVELPVVGHFRILTDPLILDAVLAAVDAGGSPAPGVE